MTDSVIPWRESAIGADELEAALPAALQEALGGGGRSLFEELSCKAVREVW